MPNMVGNFDGNFLTQKYTKKGKRPDFQSLITNTVLCNIPYVETYHKIKIDNINSRLKYMITRSKQHVDSECTAITMIKVQLREKRASSEQEYQSTGTGKKREREESKTEHHDCCQIICMSKACQRVREQAERKKKHRA
jgi:hypothetical protein